ncbi:MAG TPA: CDP-alcohol phosphatidyltransferase family protein [Kofleriaceae bacterium]|nr:CDP-alcohol phosphatidyltransferase family protein [Kofleriaceae bacterium]
MTLIDLVPLLVLAAYALPALAVFLVRSAVSGMPHEARLESVPSSPYVPRLLMEFTYWIFNQPVAVCRFLGITPNMLTFASLAITTLAATALGAGHFALGGWLLLFGFSCDTWDGILARKLGTCSNAGEFLDATMDRYNDMVGLFGLMYYYRNDPLPLALAALSVLGSTMVSYTRAKGESLGVDPNIGYMQRHERAVYLGLFTIVAPLAAAFLEPGAARPRFHVTVAMLAIVAVATNVTAILRARFVLRGLKQK